jgi:hypothetical protein
VPQFRLTIDTGPEGLSRDPENIALLANLERDERATWLGEEPAAPGRRYIYLVDAKDEADAEARARRVIGPDVPIRVTPHGRRARP